MCALTHFSVQPYIINTLGSQGAAASPQSSVVENPSFSPCFCLPHSIPEGQKDGNLSRAGDEGEQHSHPVHSKDKADMGNRGRKHDRKPWGESRGTGLFVRCQSGWTCGWLRPGPQGVGIQQLHSAPRMPVLHSPLPLATPSPLNNEAPRGVKKLVRCSQWYFKKNESPAWWHTCNLSTWEVKAGDQGSRSGRKTGRQDEKGGRRDEVRGLYLMHRQL